MKKIRLNESELVSLLKTIIMENYKYNSWGCNSSTLSTEEREWCSYSSKKVKESKNIELIKREIEKLKEVIISSDWHDLVGNLKQYKKEDPFFAWRLSQYQDFKKEILKTQNIEDNLDDFQREIAKKAIFIHKKNDQDEYSLLNKLNTNYTALSYLITRYRRQKNLISVPFQDIFDSFFGRNSTQLEKSEESIFFNFLIKFLSKKESAAEIMKEVFNTIQTTTDIGLKTELSAFDFLEQKLSKGNVINYTGDYSFVDMFGVDFMVKGLVDSEPGFVPVQVKTNVDHMYGNGKVLGNLAIAKRKDKTWKIDYFIGKNFVKNIM